MFNIHLMGDFKDLNQLTQNRSIPKSAIQFEEGNNFKDIFVLGLKIAIPIAIIMIIGAVLRIKNLDYHVEFNFLYIVLLGIAAASTYILGYVHEFIHALFYPKNAEKQIWKMLDQGAFFVYCEAETSKCRFIVMCLAPAVILGIIPYLFWLAFPLALTFIGGLMILVISCLMTFMALGDFVNVYNAVRQVPANAKVFNVSDHK